MNKPLNHYPYLAEARRTLQIALPVITAQLAHISLGFIDTVMAGNLSPRDLGAIAIGRSLYVPLYIFVLGILLAMNPIVAQLQGAGKTGEIGKSLPQGLWLSLMLALPGFLLVRSINALLPVLEVTPEIIPVTEGYLNALSWGLPAVFGYLALRFFSEGLSLTRPNMYFTLLAIPLNILGNYVFMYGRFGFPRMGAVGAGWATMLVWWVMFLGMLLFILKGKRFREYNIIDHFRRPFWPAIKEILNIGVPNGVSVTLEVGMFALTAILVGTMGVTAVASHQIAINFASITFMIPLGISIAVTARVGNEAGRGSYHGVLIAGRVGIGLSVLVMFCTAALMLLLPEAIAGIYTGDPTVINLAVQLIFLAAVFQLSDGLQVSASGVLRGLTDTKVPMYVNLVAYWMIGFPLGYYLGIIRQLGPKGFWIGWIAGLTVAAAILPWRFFRLSNLRRQRVERPLEVNVLAGED